MATEDGDPELTPDEKRTLKELAAAATSDGPTRRKVLGAGAGVAAGLIGGGGFLAGQASAQTAAGNIGSEDSIGNAFLAHVYDDGGNEVMDFPGDGSVGMEEVGGGVNAQTETITVLRDIYIIDAGTFDPADYPDDAIIAERES